MDLSIIIVNYKSRGLLRQCLKSIFENLSDSKIKYKITVVDNNSNDGSVELIREDFPQVNLIPLQENRGYARAVNIGIKSTQASFYLILNMDITLTQENTIERMIEFMKKNPKIGIAGPKLINPNGTTQVSTCTFPKFLYPLYRRTFLGKLPWAKKAIRKYLMIDWAHNETRPVGWILGTGMIVRDEAFKQVGLMDERFFMYFEDTDWCRRFWEAGWNVYYIHDIEIVHYHGRPSAQTSAFFGFLSKQTRIHIISWLKYFLKYLGKKEIKINEKN